MYPAIYYLTTIRVAIAPGGKAGSTALPPLGGFLYRRRRPLAGIGQTEKIIRNSETRKRTKRAIPTAYLSRQRSKGHVFPRAVRSTSVPGGVPRREHAPVSWEQDLLQFSLAAFLGDTNNGFEKKRVERNDGLKCRSGDCYNMP